MNWSRERTIYASIFGLALAGLAVDRCFLDAPLTGPDAAAASVPEGESAPADQSVSGGSATPNGLRLARISVGAQVLEARFQHDPTLVEARTDAFSPPSQWPVAVASMVKAVEPTEQPKTQVISFDAKLTAIFAMNGAEPTALVDGKAMKVGMTHKDFTLAELTSEAAIFVKGNQRVELTLPRAKNSR